MDSNNSTSNQDLFASLGLTNPLQGLDLSSLGIPNLN